MKSNRRSTALGLCFPLIVGLVVISACSTLDRRETEPAKSINDEVSLKSDRSYLDEAREDVPVQIQKENDELALILELMEKEDRPPYKVRSRWNTMVSKKREKFKKQMRKSREKFNKEERSKKAAFLKDAKEKRTDYFASRHERKDTLEFSRDQDAKRKEFFANLRDKRKDFETESRASRRNFNDYLKERRSDFNNAYRQYVRSYQDRKKRKTIERRAKQASKYRVRSYQSQPSSADPDVKEFANPYTGPREQLAPEGD